MLASGKINRKISNDGIRGDMVVRYGGGHKATWSRWVWIGGVSFTWLDWQWQLAVWLKLEATFGSQEASQCSSPLKRVAVIFESHWIT